MQNKAKIVVIAFVFVFLYGCYNVETANAVVPSEFSPETLTDTAYSSSCIQERPSSANNYKYIYSDKNVTATATGYQTLVGYSHSGSVEYGKYVAHQWAKKLLWNIGVSSPVNQRSHFVVYIFDAATSTYGYFDYITIVAENIADNGAYQVTIYEKLYWWVGYWDLQVNTYHLLDFYGENDEEVAEESFQVYIGTYGVSTTPQINVRYNVRCRRNSSLNVANYTGNFKSGTVASNWLVRTSSWDWQGNIPSTYETELGLESSRHLYFPDTTISATGFYNLGFISDQLSIDVPTPNEQPDNDDYILDLPYWDIYAWQIEDLSTSVVVIADNFNYTWTSIKSTLYPARHYYDPSPIDPWDWGDWSFVWNWLRDGLCIIVNFILLLLQFLLYLLWASVQLVIGTLLFGLLIPFFWNYIIYACLFAGAWVLYWGVQLLIVVVNGIWLLLQWVWENLLLPFVTWLLETFFPLIIDLFIYLWSLLISLLLWLLTLGTGNFDQILANVILVNQAIADFLTDLLVDVFTNLPAILSYTVFYALIIVWVYIKYIYAKSRGFTNRTTQLKQAYTTYLIPVNVVRKIIKGIGEVTSNAKL